MDGLYANLISISQLCDDDLQVKFDKHSCTIFDKSNKCVLEGSRFLDNCYQYDDKLICQSSKFSELDLWHQKMGHANYPNLKKLVKLDDVNGIPKLAYKDSPICETSQVLLIWESGFPKTQILTLLALVTQIGQEIYLIEKEHLVLVCFLAQ